MPQEPTLIGASVFFHTNDEDKDGDTYVSVTVRQRDNIIVARIDDNFGGFPDHSDHGPFGMQVTNASPKSEVQSGNVTIRIDPNGNDTWRFNFITTDRKSTRL